MSQYWDNSKMNDYQLEKIKKLISHAYYNVPFYQKHFKNIGLHPEDIKTLNDFKNIPVITKEDAREAGTDLLSIIADRKKILIGKTGGTTGPSLVTYKDINTRSFTWGSFYRWYNWMGIDIGDPNINIWGASSVLERSWIKKIEEYIVDVLRNRISINSFKINERNLKSIVDSISKKKPILIRGYLSAVLQLAQYLNDNNIQSINPKAVTTTTETLFQSTREFLEKQFNCQIFDQYGCGECGGIAYECSEHNGLHITSEHVFLEILDDFDNNVINNTGRIVITDLDNYAMPFIRYDNGDLGSITSESCQCGVQLPLLKSISGRFADTIILKDGSRVHGVFFTDIIYEIDVEENHKIRKFQVFQENIGEIEFRIETKVELSPLFIESLYSVLYKYFTKVNIIITDHLKNDKSGKYRYVISSIEK